MSEPLRNFPIQNGPDVPWSMMEAARGQAMRNHDQTLERLAERGGLSCYEAVCALESKKLYRNGYDFKDDTFFRAKLADLVKADQTNRIAKLEAEVERLRGEAHKAREAVRSLVELVDVVYAVPCRGDASYLAWRKYTAGPVLAGTESPAFISHPRSPGICLACGKQERSHVGDGRCRL